MTAWKLCQQDKRLVIKLKASTANVSADLRFYSDGCQPKEAVLRCVELGWAVSLPGMQYSKRASECVWQTSLG